MSLVRSFTVMLLATVSFNMATYNGYSMEDLDGKAAKGGPLKPQVDHEKGKSKKKKSKTKASSVQPGSIVDDQEEDKTAAPAPADKIIDDEAVIFDGDGAVDDKEESPPATVLSRGDAKQEDGLDKKKDDKPAQISPSSSGELVGEDALEDEEKPAASKIVVGDKKDEDKKVSAPSAAATPKPYQALMDEMASGQVIYSTNREAAALKFFPTELQLNPFSPQLIPEFNTLFCLIADNFHLYGTPDSLLVNRQERVISWFHAKIAEKQEQKSKFERDLEGQKDGILKSVASTITSLAQDIATYKLRLAESLDDMAKIDKFRGFTIAAIETTEATRNQYQAMKDKEANASKQTEYQTKMNEFEGNIAKFREQIRIIETVLHAKYPFHREGTYFMGVIPIDALRAKISRFGMTGAASLSSLTLPKSKLEDKVSDEGGHFTNLMKYLMGESDQTPVLKDAIEAKRIILQNAAATS